MFQNVKQPESLVKNINGFYYNNNELITEDEAVRVCSVDQKMIIKPTLDTQGGKNVVLFKCINGKSDYNDMGIKQLFGLYGKDFIVQKAVNQHPQMAMLNTSSLNTFRIMSYLKDNSVDVLSIVVRMGKEGSITDNNTGGGFCCGVKADGSLNEISHQGNTGERYEATDQGIPFKELKLPFVDKLDDVVRKLHKKAPYFKLISWDLAIDSTEEVVLIEYNIHGQDINIHQLNNGPVLSPILKEALKNNRG